MPMSERRNRSQSKNPPLIPAATTSLPAGRRPTTRWLLGVTSTRSRTPLPLSRLMRLDVWSSGPSNRQVTAEEEVGKSYVLEPGEPHLAPPLVTATGVGSEAR
jgi:hypothetical protein